MLEHNTCCHFTLTKSLFSDPHVDHDPLHDASDAKKDGKKSVHPETFTREKAQEMEFVFTPLKHAGYQTYISRMSINSPQFRGGNSCGRLSGFKDCMGV